MGMKRDTREEKAMARKWRSGPSKIGRRTPLSVSSKREKQSLSVFSMMRRVYHRRGQCRRPTAVTDPNRTRSGSFSEPLARKSDRHAAVCGGTHIPGVPSIPDRSRASLVSRVSLVPKGCRSESRRLRNLRVTGDSGLPEAQRPPLARSKPGETENTCSRSGRFRARPPPVERDTGHSAAPSRTRHRYP